MNNRRPYFILSLGLVLVFLLIILALPRHSADTSTSISSLERSEQFLRDRLEKLNPATEEAKTIRRNLIKLRLEKESPKLQTENPDAFLTALREVKTGTDGSIYPSNYKLLELEKAREFKMRKGLRTKTLPWISRGPGNVSGRGRSMAVDPSDPTGNTWFVATVGGGVWKTTDAGENWQLKTPDLLTLSTTSIIIAPSNPDIIYVGTGMGYGRIVDLEGSGVWKSTDHGETWFQLESTANGELLEAINRMIVDPEDENTILVCSNNSYTTLGPNGGDRKSGIFKTVDGGLTWVQVFDPDDFFGLISDNRVQQIIANPDDFNVIYATVNEVGVVKSIDEGITWTVSADDFALPADIGRGEGTYSGVSTRVEMAIAPTDTDRIYASVERPFGSATLFMSTNAGSSWVELRNVGDEINWHSANGDSGADGAYTSGWFNHTITVNPFNEDLIYLGAVNIFKMLINPTAFTRSITPIAWRFAPNQYDVPYIHADNHFFVTIPDDDSQTFRIVCSNDGGIAYSPDKGVTWEMKLGMITTQFYGVDKKPGEDVYIGGTQDNGTWLSEADPGNNSTWRHVIGGDGFETVWNYRDPNLIMGASQNGNVRRTEDGGISWFSVPEARGSGGPFISKIANVKTDPDLIFTVTYEGVNRSDDFGANWQLVNLNPWIGYRPFSNVKISIANPQVVWASSRLTIDTYGNIGGVHVSRDGGLSFENVTFNLPAGLSEASGLATHPTLEGTAFLLFSAPGVPKILRTDDFGETWLDISGFSAPSAKKSPTGFPDVAVFTLVVMPFDENIIWAGTEIGLFISEDGGSSWSISDNGFPAVSVFDMKIVDNEIVVGTYGRGIWTSEIPELENYELPTPILAPQLTELALAPTGELRLEANLRSAYDSTHVIIDNQVEVRISANSSGMDTTILIPVRQDRALNGKVVAYQNGNTYMSSTLEEEVFVTSPASSYTNLFNAITPGNDFIGNGFSIQTIDGFSNPAIHSLHPYPNQAELIYQLKIPIVVKNEDAFLRYMDVVLVEEGVSDFYTDPGFYDFVIVEATSNGADWKPLVPGYDSRTNQDWSTSFNNGLNGNEGLYVSHVIDLLDTFNPDDTIFLRFRLLSDPFANGWGWAIDNLIIQNETILSLEDELVLDLNIFPNPASETLTIQITKDQVKKISIMDGDGRIVMEKTVSDLHKNEVIDISALADGLYILQAHGNKGIRSMRFVKD